MCILSIEQRKQNKNINVGEFQELIPTSKTVKNLRTANLRVNYRLIIIRTKTPNFPSTPAAAVSYNIVKL